MSKFDELLEVASRLNGPGGCPWDQKQTFFSLQPYVLEEAHEVVEAVDAKVDEKIVEELGDLLYTVVFYAKVAQRDGRFTMDNVIEAITDKLIRRHPHVFGDVKIEKEEEIVQNWEKIKKEEKGKEQRESSLDGIPPTMSSLSRAQKVAKTLHKHRYPFLPFIDTTPKSEKELGEKLLQGVCEAEHFGLDAESALRRVLQQVESSFRQWESEEKG